MKIYHVFYWIKKNRSEHLYDMFVSAANKDEACKICREEVMKHTGRNALRPTTKDPDLVGMKDHHHYL